LQSLQFLIDPTPPPLLSTNPTPDIKARNENHSAIKKETKPKHTKIAIIQGRTK